MEQVRLRTNPQRSVMRYLCGRLLLFERDRLYPHGSQACQQKCRAEPLAIDLAVDLTGRLFDPLVFKQPGQLLVVIATSAPSPRLVRKPTHLGCGRIS